MHTRAQQRDLACIYMCLLSIYRCDDVNVRQVAVAIVAQVVFTWECVVKILAEGYSPLKYFTDRENGAWNKCVCKWD